MVLMRPCQGRTNQRAFVVRHGHMLFGCSPDAPGDGCQVGVHMRYMNFVVLVVVFCWNGSGCHACLGGRAGIGLALLCRLPS